MRVDVARAAGLTYLAVVVTGIFSLAYVPSQVPLSGDPRSVLTNVSAAETLYRLGILSGLICYCAFLILPLALYRLLHIVDRRAAVLMVAFAVASVPLSFAGLQARFGLIALAHEAAGVASDILAGQVGAALRASRDDMLLAQLFWGLWLLPLGWLIVKSAAIPRLLGGLLILGGLGYVATVAGTIIMADFGSLAIAPWLRRPAAIGEIGTALWLSVMGARLTPLTPAP